jgi:restriction endonuclease S subunit
MSRVIRLAGLKNECLESNIFNTQMSTSSTTSLESFLMSIRDKCRNKGAQMDENGNIYADLIYDDLLFLKELSVLVESGGVSIDLESILRGTSIKNIRLDTIASLSQCDSAHVSAVFNRLWLELQRSSLACIFDREFALKSILKDEKLKSQYIPLLISLLDYTGKVQLIEHEDTDPYEYFTKELKKGKSKYYGQFYTPEILTDSCVNEIKPQFGEIGLDPAAGTGKFMRSASKYISKNQAEYSEWDAYQHMRMVEIENKIYRQGILGTFIKYKKLPNMANQRKGNSFDLLIKEKEQVDYILANPPYGGTVDGFDEIYYNVSTEQKGKRLVKTTTVKPEVVYPFEFVKKDTCVLFIQLCVNKLKDGGRAAVIFNATVMNDSHRDVIKWFLSKCNLYKIIVNPSGTFKCTGIETYSFIFTKGKPTEKIEYYDVVTGNKIGELTMAQIVERGWDIRPIFQAKNTNNGCVVFKKISEICTVEKGTIQATKAVEGNYNCYSGAETVYTHNEHNFVGPAIVYVNGSSGSKGRIHYAKEGEKFAATTLVQVLKVRHAENTDIEYIRWFFNLTKDYILKVFESSNMRGTIQVEDLMNFEIPTVPLEIQQEIVATLDRIFADPQDMKDCLAFTDKAMDLMLKDPSGKLLEDVMGALRLKRAQLATASSINSQMAAVMRSVGARGYKKKKLGDVCDLLSGKGGNYQEDGNTYPYYDSNGITGYRKDFCFEGDYIITARKMSIGAVHFASGKFWSSDNTINICIKDATVLITRFFYLWLLLNNKVLKDLSSGIKPGIRKSEVAEILMPIPPLPIQQEVLTMLNEMEAELKVMEQMAAKAEQRAKYILDGYLSIQTTVVPEPVQEVVVEPQPTNQLVPLTEEVPKPKKRVFKLKKSVEPSE